MERKEVGETVMMESEMVNSKDRLTRMRRMLLREPQKYQRERE